MVKSTVCAGSNIAFIKYWGTTDSALNLPLNNSISMTLADAHTTTTVTWDGNDHLRADAIKIDGVELNKENGRRIVRHLDRIRSLTGTELRARVVSQTNFPAASGIASSASGFAALTVAACQALDIDLSAESLSRLARLGSGSACRSLFAGFVEWQRGNDDKSSVATQIAGPDQWALCDLVAIVSTREKRISSAQGHELAATSPLLQGRLRTLPSALNEVRSAIATRDIERLGLVIEQDAIAMHAVMMTSQPPLYYWNGATIELIQAVHQWREDGMAVYFTIDAGPNVHLICERSTALALESTVTALPYVKKVLLSGPGPAPIMLDKHLF